MTYTFCFATLITKEGFEKGISATEKMFHEGVVRVAKKHRTSSQRVISDASPANPPERNEMIFRLDKDSVVDDRPKKTLTGKFYEE